MPKGGGGICVLLPRRGSPALFFPLAAILSCGGSVVPLSPSFCVRIAIEGFLAPLAERGRKGLERPTSFFLLVGSLRWAWFLGPLADFFASSLCVLFCLRFLSFRWWGLRACCSRRSRPSMVNRSPSRTKKRRRFLGGALIFTPVDVARKVCAAIWRDVMASANGADHISRIPRGQSSPRLKWPYFP